MNAIAIGAFDQQIIRGGYDGGIGNDRLIRAAEIAAEQNFLSRRQPKLDEPRSEDMARRKKASRTAGGKLEQIAELLRLKKCARFPRVVLGIQRQRRLVPRKTFFVCVMRILLLKSSAVSKAETRDLIGCRC